MSTLFKNGKRFNSLFLSNRIKKVIIKKGKVGTLYLAIAPKTGVVSPIIKNWIITNEKQNKTYFHFISFNGLIKTMQIIISSSINMFSNPVMSIIGDRNSHK